MAFIVAGLIILGGVVLFDLALTYGVMRRLREHSAILAAQRAPARHDLRPGDQVGAFSAVTVDGVTVSSSTMAEETVVAFLSPGCAPCEQTVPELLRQLDRQVDVAWLVVVAEDDSQPGPMAEQFRGRAQVVVEPPGLGKVQRAFGIGEFPTLVRVDTSTIVAVNHKVSDMFSSAPVSQ